jgi:hypothetical protein
MAMSLQKNSPKKIKAWEQCSQSHPPFSVQLTSQCGCHFVLASKQVATSNLNYVETTILRTHMDIIENN